MTTKNPLLGITQTENIIGINRKTLRRWWEKDKFPKPVKFNSRLYWRQSTIDVWLQDNFEGAA